jgi:methyl-accepting chemotaxis protein
MKNMANQTKQNNLDYEQLVGVNVMIDLLADRSVIKKILNTLPNTNETVIDVRLSEHKKLLDNLENYGIKFNGTIKGIDVREQNIKIASTIKLTIRSHFTVQQYIINDWVKIDRFLDAMNKLNKGEQHRYLNQLVCLLKDKWVSTFYHNSNKDCNKLVLKFKNLNVASNCKLMIKFTKKMKFLQKQSGRAHNEFVKSYEDQMFNKFEHVKLEEHMFSAVSTFREAADSIKDVVNKDIKPLTQDIAAATSVISTRVDDTATKINVAIKDMSRTAAGIDYRAESISQDVKFTTNKISHGIDQLIANSNLLTDKFLSIIESWDSSSVYISFFMNLIKFVSFAYLVAKKSNQDATSITALITLILPTGIGNCLLNSLSRAVLGIICLFKERNQIQEQGYDDEIKTNEKHYNFGKVMLETIKIMISSIFTGISPKAFATVRENSFFLRTISDIIRSCTTIVDFMIKSISFIMEYIVNKIMEYYGMLPEFLKDIEFEKVIDDYIKCKQEDVFINCGENIIDARRVISLRDKLLDIEQKMNIALVNNKTLTYKVMPYIRIMVVTVDKAYENIPPQYKGVTNAHRKKPYFVYIWGKPRIGKSKIFQPLLVNAIAQRIKLIDSYQDPQHYCVFRKMGAEFWDGGQGKKVVWYNDIFQTIMADNTLDLAIDELGAVVDDNPYHMNMANLVDKSRCYLTAPLVVANGQDDFGRAGFVNSRTWSQGDHLARRRDMNLELILRTKWMNCDGGVDSHKVKKFIKSNPDECFGSKDHKLFPNDMYIIRFHDVRTGAAFKELTMEETIKYVCDHADNYMNKQQELTDSLIHNMKDLWTDQMYSTVGEMYACNLAGDSTIDDVNRVAYTHGTQIHDEEQEAQLYEFSDALPYEVTEPIEVIAHNKTLVKIEELPEDDFDGDADAKRKKQNEDNFKTHITTGLAGLTLQILATFITHYLTGKITNLLANEFTKLSRHFLISDWIIYGCKRWGWPALLLAINAELVALGLKVYISYLITEKLLEKLAPIIAYALHITLAKPILRTFNTIEELIMHIYEDPSLSVKIFRDYLDGLYQDARVVMFDTYDLMLKSYYEGLEFYHMCKNPIYRSMKYQQHKNYMIEFKNDAMDAIKDTYQMIKDYMQQIPGWVFLSMGVALFSIVAYSIYKMFSSSETEPQSHEGNIKAARRRIQRRIVKRQQQVSLDAHSYNYTNIDIENIFRTSYAYIEMETRVDDTWVTVPLSGMALNLLSNIFVIPYHYWYRFHHCNNIYAEQGYQSRLKITWSTRAETVAYFDSITVCQLDYGHSRDLVYLRVKGLNCGRDLSNFFLSQDNFDNVNLIGAYLYGYRPRGKPNFNKSELINIGQVTKISSSYDINEKVEPILKSIIPSQTIIHDYCLYYTNCRTGPGDCSMVFMHTDPKYNQKVMGIHTAGNEGAEIGLASIIYKEDIEDVIDFFSQTEKPITLLADQQYADYSTELSEKSKKYQDIGFTIVANTATVEVNNKRRRITASLPTKTKIQQSVVYNAMEDDFGPANMLPAALSKFKNEKGELISPFEKAFAKMGKLTKNLPQKLHDDLVASCSDAIMSWPSDWNKSNARLLTWDEAINGFMNLKGLDLTTSSGFPFTLTHNQKKKWFNFQNNKWVMNEELMNKVLEMEQQLKDGKIPPIYFIDTLKDETRPREKVKLGKTRLFQVGNMAWTILFRKYYGWFMGHCHSTFEFGEMMSGINPNSYNWDQLAGKMIFHSKKQSPGDYANYDASLGHQACDGCSDSANVFYKHGDGSNTKEDDFVRKGLILGSINTFHIVEDFIVFMRQGNPSGFLLTTIINNFCNMYYHRYAFIKLTGMSLSKFREYVYTIFFGDDCNASVKEQIADVYNMLTISQVFAELGLEYTSADKSAITKDFVTIENMTFLKRRFYFDEQLNIWRSRLDHDVIMEIPRWSESDPANVTDQLNRFNSCLMELANYSEQEFNEVKNKFKKYCYQLNELGYCYNVDQLFSYQYVMHLMYPRHYPCTESYVDPTLLGEQTNGVTLYKSAERDLGKLLNYTQIDYSVYNLYEQQYTATNEKIQINDIQMVRKKAKKCVRSTIQCTIPIIRPVVQQVVDSMTNVLSCPIVLADDVFDYAVKEIHHVTSPEKKNATTQTISLQPQGIDDEKEVNDMTVTKEKTTVFEDVNAVHDTEAETEKFSSIMYGTILDMSIENFLGRPYVVNSLTWTSTNTLYQSMFTLDFPYCLTSLVNIQNKLTNIAFWAPDIEVTIRANTTVFHYGALCFNWIPQAAALSQNNFVMQTCMNSKNWSQLLANARQAIRINIPYTHYKDKITIGRETLDDGTGNGAREDLFRLFCYCAWPLSTAQTGVVAPVNVSIIARIVKPRLNGFTIDAFTPQGFDIIDDDLVNDPLPATTYQGDTHVTRAPPKPFVRKEKMIYKGAKIPFNSYRNPRRLNAQGADAEAEASSGGLISRTMLQVADFLGKLSFVPLVGEIAAPVSAFTATAGFLAKWMGFSVPPNLEVTSPMHIRQPLQMKWTDVPTTVPVGPTDGLIAKDFSKVNSSVDEMSIKHIIGSPGLIYTGAIFNTNLPGDILFRRAISPQEMFYGDWINPSPAYTGAGSGFVNHYGTYMLAVSSWAKAWRGGMQFFFSPMCTQFHSCRVAIIYQPYTLDSADTPTVPTITNFTNTTNLVLDLQSGQTTSFVVPYQQTQTFLHMKNEARVGIGTRSKFENNGYITIMLLNELTSVITTPTNIGFQVFAQPCDDFQFIGTNIGGNTNLFPQGLDEVDECMYPSSSIGCLRTVKPVVFGKPTGFTVHRTQSAFEFTSLKQMLNMYTSLTYIDNAASSFTFSLSDAMVVPLCAGATPMMQPLQMFRYYTGGFRMGAFSNTPVAYGVGYSCVTDTTTNKNITVTGSAQWFSTTRGNAVTGGVLGQLTHGSTTQGMYYSPVLTTTPLDITIPYFSCYKCLPLNCGGSLAAPVSISQTPTAFGVIIINGSSGRTNFMLGGADDLILGFLMPCLPFRSFMNTGVPKIPKLALDPPEPPVKYQSEREIRKIDGSTYVGEKYADALADMKRRYPKVEYLKRTLIGPSYDAADNRIITIVNHDDEVSQQPSGKPPVIKLITAPPVASAKTPASDSANTTPVNSVKRVRRHLDLQEPITFQLSESDSDENDELVREITS